MNYKKANRFIDDVICIIAIIIFPMFLLELLGIERKIINEESK